ncbi:MAG: substrate-binding domain-containing protein [Deltaproteobacteria bacterium]|nr:substrate-binding domain-containing protein [Candidatus Anaeroferrophillus wilburensis]MBN2888581.1 substrate-binding domain-containing protein [Deltaproteobacteria bacterium]
MQRTRRTPTIAIVFMAVLAIITSGCAKPFDEDEAQKELLIYCGMTMIEPIREIADLMEKENDCVIKIIKGGSGELYRCLKANQLGDLFLPGAESYIAACADEGLIAATAPVGYNQAALMVPKGNPGKITGDLICLTDERHRVVLANPETGSIGRETAAILKKRGIYDAAYQNAIFLTVDSKDLVKALREGSADLTINWRATTCRQENRSIMEAVAIKADYATPERLVLGLLSCSAYPEIARQFMDYCTSPAGRKIFKKHGFLNGVQP